MKAPSRLPRLRFDDDEYDGSPLPISSRTRKSQVVSGPVNPRQTMAAITKPKGKGGHQGSNSFGGSSTSTRTRQTGPKLSGKARRAERKGAKKGGKR